MIGPKKLSEIRAELRGGFQMTDKELLAWFNREIQELEARDQIGRVGRETLHSLRDALLAPGKKNRAASGDAWKPVPRRGKKRAGST